MEISVLGFGFVCFVVGVALGFVAGCFGATDNCNRRYLAMLDEAIRAGYPEGAQSPMKDKD